MLNQSFSVENIRKSYDVHTRRGENLDKMFFPVLDSYNRKIKNVRVIQKNIKRGKYVPRDKKKSLLVLAKKMEQLKSFKESELERCIESIVRKIGEGKVDFDIRCENVNGKNVFIVNQSGPEVYFALKQIQYNLKKCYKLSFYEKDVIVKQLFSVLNCKMPCNFVRVDVKSFYENIPVNEIIDYIYADPILSMASKKIIMKIISSCKKAGGSFSGVPRGLGISAYLSEVYMRKFDEYMIRKNGVIYYARYVDDIVVVFRDDVGMDVNGCFDFVEKSLDEKGLSVHRSGDKVVCSRLPSGNNVQFDFLGYSFSIRNGSVALSISKKRFNRVVGRIYSSFNAYYGDLRRGVSGGSLLHKRIRFLTSNVRMFNNKSNYMYGIYFNNRYVTDTVFLDKLDAVLRGLCDVLPACLKAKMAKCSFRRGFEDRVFVKMSTVSMSEVVRGWKYEK